MRSQRGAVVLESIFAVALLMIVALGVIQIALLLFARNMVQASAHEAARAAIERGLAPDAASETARRVATASMGSMARRLDIATERRRIGTQEVVTVRVTAILEPAGPIPIAPAVVATARIGTTAEPR